MLQRQVEQMNEQLAQLEYQQALYQYISWCGNLTICADLIKCYYSRHVSVMSDRCSDFLVV